MSKGKLSSIYSEKTTWGDGESSEKEGGKVWNEALCDNLPTICFAIDREGVIRNINKWGARELGYEVGELLDRSILTIIVPEEREKMQAELWSFFDKQEESLKLIKQIRIKIRLEGKDGKIKEVELLGNRLKQKLEEGGLKEEDLIVEVIKDGKINKNVS